MNKNLLLFSFAAIFACMSFAQGKIKGNRIVSNNVTQIKPFSRLVLDENFKITLIQGAGPSVEINADENLHDVIDFAVLDGSLKFNTNRRITSKKAMEIKVVYTDILKEIELKGDSELTSEATLKVDTLKLTTTESSKAFLNLKTISFTHLNNGKSKSELNVMTDTANIKGKGNSDLEALINASTITIDLHESSSAKIEGDTNALNVYADNSSKLNAQNLTTQECILTAKEKADVKIEAQNNLTLDVYGTTETTIYGKAKIILKNFQNNAKLIKKEKNK